jgi:DNA repair protein RecN (Recombination protein N)
MLRALRIENFAIVDELEIEFGEGLNVLTGETGAGKSIVVDAISLLRGERATTRRVRTGSDRAIVEGLFDVRRVPEGLAERLAGLGLDPGGGEFVLRRDIHAAGTGRCYVNGRMSSAARLAEIGVHLCDIHGQHEHQSLLRTSLQMRLFDGFADAADAREAVSALHRQWREVRERLAEHRRGREERLRRIEDLRYAVEEIEGAGLRPGEEEVVEQELRTMENVRRLVQAAGAVVEGLSGEEGSILEGLRAVRRELEEIARIDPGVSDAADEARDCAYRLEEIAERLRGYRDSRVFDPERLEMLRERRERIRRLLGRYGPTIEDVIARGERARRELSEVETGGRREAELEAEEGRLAEDLRRAADDLSRRRRSGAPAFEKEVVAGLRRLGMEKARFRVDLEPLPDGAIEVCGAERLSFLVSTNPGEPEKPLEQVVSGGELSRIMLVLRAMQADADPAATLVFDEVDAGIGGQVAHAVGEKLLRVARGRQVIVVTHLPQIAARAGRHIGIRKSVTGGRTVVRVAALDGDDRLEEIIRMLGGDVESRASRRHAGELLGRAAKAGAGRAS